MDQTTAAKAIVLEFLQVVWGQGNLARLGDFWAVDCVNHASPAPNVGLEALHDYHASMMQMFSAFSDIDMKVLSQIAEDDKVVTHIKTTARHTGPFFGIAATNKTISTFVIRIDQIKSGKIVAHWSVSDAASIGQQLQ
jgi:predicted ester cyclase